MDGSSEEDFFSDLKAGSGAVDVRALELMEEAAKVRAHNGTFVGSPYWVPPEMLDHSTSGPFTDLWSLGVIAYELLIGGKPFEGSSHRELYNKILTR